MSKRMNKKIYASVFAFSCISSVLIAQSTARFIGNIVFAPEDDGRKMTLLQPYGFIDPGGKTWQVPAGWKVDGASIPRPFWSIIGGPFEGKYRNASVIHDYYCDVKTERWQDVHRVFYDAMRANNVSKSQAATLYAAVRNFGPRWIAVTNGSETKVISGAPVLDEAQRDAAFNLARRSNSTLEQIDALSEALISDRSVQVADALAEQNPQCSPIFTNQLQPMLNVSTNLPPVRTEILCAVSDEDKAFIARANLTQTRLILGRLINSQVNFLDRAVTRYIADDSDTNWLTIQNEAKDIQSLIRLSLRSTLALDNPELVGRVPDLNDVYSVLGQRTAMIDPLLNGPKLPPEEMKTWSGRYRGLMRRLVVKLNEMDGFIEQNGANKPKN